VEMTLRLAGALWRFWYVRGHLSEGMRWLDRALDLEGGDAALRSKVLGGGGELAHSQGDLDRAQELRQEALTMSTQLGDEAQIADTLNGLAFVIRRRGEFARARALHQEALDLYRKLDDRWGVSRSMDLLGRAAAFQGDFEAALPLLEEGLKMWRQVGDREGIAESTALLGIVALGKGDNATARSFLREGREIMDEVGDPRGVAKMTVALADAYLNDGDPVTAQELYKQALTLFQDVEDKWWLSWCLEGVAAVAVSRTQPSRATRLFGAAASLREAIGAPRPPAFRAYCERDLDTARRQLDEAAFATARSEGRAMGLEVAIQYALEQPTQPEQISPAEPVPDNPFGLSDREVEVLRLVAEGLTDGQVARELHISPRTVGGHLGSIYRKLGVPSRAAAARKAVERGVI
jgi:ATP/maltotriose-dependent transcriptional regulator MalT